MTHLKRTRGWRTLWMIHKSSAAWKCHFCFTDNKTNQSFWYKILRKHWHCSDKVLTVTCKILCSLSQAEPLAARTAPSAVASKSKDIFSWIFIFLFYYFPPDLMDTGTKQPCAASSVGASLRARLGWARDPAWPRSLNTLCTAWPGPRSVVISVIICETESAPGSDGQDVNNPSGCSFVAEHSGVFR